MFVCSCLAVTDRTVNAAIAAGASSVEEITDRCAAGGCCGGCWLELQHLLDSHRSRQAGAGRHSAA